ncbi:unnamed protein product [Trichogramma brassicae]|uniref:Uncharacterized protein n=1 Tax=Trichogramma brassicae TaxID=86971 RepID=A0A6H5I1W2_9HYME|nr:unnamed protein product [Trichogramma brassicae]
MHTELLLLPAHNCTATSICAHLIGAARIYRLCARILLTRTRSTCITHIMHKKKTKSTGMIETNAAPGTCSTIRIDSVCVYKIFAPETHPFVVHTPLQRDREIYQSYSGARLRATTRLYVHHALCTANAVAAATTTTTTSSLVYHPRGCDLGLFNFLIFYLYLEKKFNPKKTN